MLAFGYFGEQAIINPAMIYCWAGFAVGMAGWGFILFEIFAGEGGQVENVRELDQYVAWHFIVSTGWSIYLLSYLATSWARSATRPSIWSTTSQTKFALTCLML